MAQPKPIPLATLAGALAEKHGCTKAEAQKILTSVQSAIVDQLVTGVPIRLPEIGTFTPVMQPERQARNPATGEAMTTPAKKILRFKSSKAVKDRLNAD